MTQLFELTLIVIIYLSYQSNCRYNHDLLQILDESKYWTNPYPSNEKHPSVSRTSDSKFLIIKRTTILKFPNKNEAIDNKKRIHKTYIRLYHSSLMRMHSMTKRKDLQYTELSPETFNHIYPL